MLAVKERACFAVFLSHVRLSQNAKWLLPMVTGAKTERFTTSSILVEDQGNYQRSILTLTHHSITTRMMQLRVRRRYRGPLRPVLVGPFSMQDVLVEDWYRDRKISCCENNGRSYQDFRPKLTAYREWKVR